jgi:uncharacterized protein (TIGR02284 family)
METKEKTDTAIRDIIVINNDRSEGYKKAAEETKDVVLKAMFTRYSEQSKKFADELKPFFTDVDKLPKPGETKNTGKLYRVWMDVKAAITANDRKAILNSCEFGEDKAKSTYDDVLKDTEDLSSKGVEIIRRQRTEIQKSHDEVKALRDAARK